MTKKPIPAPENLDEILRDMDQAYQAAISDVQPVDSDPEFIRGFMKTQFLNEVLEALEKDGLTASELSRRMGVSRERVRCLLNETENFQMETMAKIAAALSRQVSIKLLRPCERVEKRNLRQVAQVIHEIKHTEDEPKLDSGNWKKSPNPYHFPHQDTREAS